MADDDNQSKRYVGVSYSPATHEEQGKVHGSLNFHEGSVRGRIEVAGFNIPIGKEERKHAVGSKGVQETYIIKRPEPEFVRDDRELHVKLERTGNLVYGYLNRYGKFGKIAFLMGDKQDYNPEMARQTLPNNGDPRSNAPPEEMPEEGLPIKIPIPKQAEYWDDVQSGGDA